MNSFSKLLAVKTAMQQILRHLHWCCLFLALSCTSQSPVYNESSLPVILPAKYPTEWYPAEQIRLSHVGKVIVGYSVSATGAPENVHSISATESGFITAATSAVNSFRFSIPHNWVATAGPLKQFQIQFIFDLDGLPKIEATPGITAIVTTASRVSGNRLK